MIYEDYLNNRNKELTEIIASSAIDNEVKTLILSQVCTEIADLPMGEIDEKPSIDMMVSQCELVVYDKKIDKQLRNQLSVDECKEAIVLCDKQRKNMELCIDKSVLNSIVHKDMDACVAQFEKKQIAAKYMDELIKQDKALSRMFNAKKSIDKDQYDKEKSEIQEFSRIRDLCKESNMSLPALENNQDESALFFKLDLYQRILETDDILNKLKSAPINEANCNATVSYCDYMTELLEKCASKHYRRPSIQNAGVVVVKERYNHYLKMIGLDRKITQDMHSNVGLEPLISLVSNPCKQQAEAINTCKEKEWSIPTLEIPDPSKKLRELKAALNAQKKQKEQQEKERKQKRMLILCGIGAVALIVIILVGVIVHNSKYTKAPMGTNDVYGKKSAAVEKEFKNAGFKNIRLKKTSHGYLEPDLVLNIEIDDDKEFSKGESFAKSSEVTIYYSDDERTNIEDLLSDWESQEINEFSIMLENKGYYVKLENQNNGDDLDWIFNGKIVAIYVGDVEYTDGPCYASSNADIILVVG